MFRRTNASFVVVAKTLHMDSKPPLQLFVVWLKAAGQGVGGAGTSGLSAYNDLVISRDWISADEWAECWAVCQLAPGVTTIAMALLTGSRLGRAAGAAASFAGLVVPSLFVTLLLTIVYAKVEGTPLLQAGLHGLFAAAVAATLVNSWRLGKPVLRVSALKSPILLAVAVFIAIGAAVLILTTDLPVFALLLCGGAVMAAALWVTEGRDHKASR
jgi:chromate transport protein ChrA